MPVNYLLIESLQKFHHYYGDDFKVECPAGSGQLLSLTEVADELAAPPAPHLPARRDGRRPVFGGDPRCDRPDFRDHVLFYEYFHGDTGRGVGASHQTGWTGLVALVADAAARDRRATRRPPLPRTAPTQRRRSEPAMPRAQRAAKAAARAA